jgi:hypothetical protein
MPTIQRQQSAATDAATTGSGDTLHQHDYLS